MVIARNLLRVMSEEGTTRRATGGFAQEGGVDMGMSAEGEQTFAVPWEQAYPKVLEAIPTVPKMRVRTADPSTGRIEVNKKISWKSWGEDIFVDVYQPTPGQTTVKVRSEVKAQLVDWGVNKQNVQSILAAVSQAFGAAPPPA
jgi:hypothetical protein